MVGWSTRKRKTHYHARIHTHLGWSECLVGGTGMGGGSFASGRRATFRQGKRVASAMKTFGISTEDGKRIIEVVYYC